MSEMSAQGHGGNLRPTANRQPEATRFLDNPHCLTAARDVRLATRGRYVALLRGSLGSCFMATEDGELSWVVRSFKELIWGHTAALLRLEGAAPQALLGEDRLLVKSLDRPVYASVPGHDDVWVVFLQSNPQKLPLEEVFYRVHARFMDGVPLIQD